MEKTLVRLAAAIFITFSCTTPEGLTAMVGRGLGTSSHGRFPIIEETLQEETPEKASVYMSGVRYPDGYDWHHATDEVEHVVFLLGDGEPLFESSSAPSEADTRLISNGRLFHTVTDGDSTIVYANGSRIFAYRAKEMTAALEDDGNGHIMTIGEPRSTEESFTYRVNGSAKMKRDGLIASDNIIDGRFCYRDTDGNYITVENGTEKETVAPAAGGTIASVIVHGGKTYAYEKVGPYILIQSEGQGVFLNAPSYQYRNIRLEDWFFHDGEGFLTFVSAQDIKDLPKALVYRDDRLVLSFDGYEFYNILWDGDSLKFILKSFYEENYAVADMDGLPEPLPEGFVPHSKRAMDYSDGVLRLALDTPEGPVIWQDGEMARFSFNGYIDNITTR